LSRLVEAPPNKQFRIREPSDKCNSNFQRKRLKLLPLKNSQSRLSKAGVEVFKIRGQELYQDDQLKGTDLFHNKGAGLLICMAPTCRFCLCLDTAITHIKACGKSRCADRKEMRDCISRVEAFIEFHTRDNLLSSDRDLNSIRNLYEKKATHEPIVGLPLFVGIRCRICFRITTSLDMFGKMHPRNEPCWRSKDNFLVPVVVQCIRVCNRIPTFIEVNYPLDALPIFSQTFISSADTQTSSRASQLSSDIRAGQPSFGSISNSNELQQLTLLEMNTGWHLWIKPVKEELMKFMSFTKLPKKKWEKNMVLLIQSNVCVVQNMYDRRAICDSILHRLGKTSN
jgi:hypothetical protein